MAVQTVAGLVEMGFEVNVVLPEFGQLKALFEASGAKTIIRPVPVLRKKSMSPHGLIKLLWATVMALPSALQVIKEYKPDVVYVNTIIQPLWILLSFLLGTKSVTHVREAENSRSKLLRFVLVAPLVMSASIVCNSKSTKAFVDGSYSRLASKSHVIYNGKNWSEYFRSDPAETTGGLELLVVGRISPRKGQDVMLSALSTIRSSGVDARVTFIGDVFPGYEWYLQDLKDTIAEKKLDEFVVFGGFMDDVSSQFERCQVVVVPSIIEPFGTVALEGMAAKRPVIVSRTEGLVEIVTDRETGLLVRPGDSDDLAKAVTLLDGDPELRERLASTGYAHVNSAFSASRYNSEITEMLRNTLVTDRSKR